MAELAEVTIGSQQVGRIAEEVGQQLHAGMITCERTSSP